MDKKKKKGESTSSFRIVSLFSETRSTLVILLADVFHLDSSARRRFWLPIERSEIVWFGSKQRFHLSLIFFTFLFRFHSLFYSLFVVKNPKKHSKLVIYIHTVIPSSSLASCLSFSSFGLKSLHSSLEKYQEKLLSHPLSFSFYNLEPLYSSLNLPKKNTNRN